MDRDILYIEMYKLFKRRRAWIGPVLVFLLIIISFPLTLDINSDNPPQIYLSFIWISTLLVTMLGTELIFSDDFGLTHRSQIRKIFETMVRQAKLKHRGFHSLRHTHASNLFEADFDILTVSKRFGHSSVAITMDIYTHFFERKKKKDAKRLQDVQQSMQSSS